MAYSYESLINMEISVFGLDSFRGVTAFYANISVREPHSDLLECFRAKWKPVRVKKTRQSNELQSFSGST